MVSKIFIFMIFIPCDLINFGCFKFFGLYYASKTGDYADWKVLNWKFSQLSLFIYWINDFFSSHWRKPGLREPGFKILTTYVGQTISSKVSVLDIFRKSDFWSNSFSDQETILNWSNQIFKKNIFENFWNKNIWVTVNPSNWETSLAYGHQKVTKQITN